MLGKPSAQQCFFSVERSEFHRANSESRRSNNAATPLGIFPDEEVSKSRFRIPKRVMVCVYLIAHVKYCFLKWLLSRATFVARSVTGNTSLS